MSQDDGSKWTEPQTRKWVALLEVEVECREEKGEPEVRHAMEGQLSFLGFGQNMFWAVTDRRVRSIRRKWWFW